MTWETESKLWKAAAVACVAILFGMVIAMNVHS